VLLVALGLAAVAVAQPPPAPTAPTAPTLPDPPRLIVSDVLIKGSTQVPTENIKNQLRTRVGKEYVPDTLQEDIRGLFGTRQFANVWADKVEDGPGHVKIYIYIKDYPSVVQKVTYLNSHVFNNDDLDGITGVRKGMPLNPLANRLACGAVVKRLSEEGRPFASCTLVKGGEPSDTEVVFNINEGPKVRVRDIQFTGNTFVTAGVLRNRINSSKMFLGLPISGTYSANLAEADVHDLIKYYRSNGFHDVRVNRELVYEPNGKEVTLIFHVVEGVRYRIAAAPQVLNVKSISHEQLEALGAVKADEFYNEPKISRDTERIKARIGYDGRDARVTAIPVYPQDKPGIVQVNYEVEEKPPARVGQIFIVGNERTKQNVILRQLPLYPGQILTYPDLKQAERNLARLNIFEATPDGAIRPTVTVLDNPLDPDNPVKDILVTVQEANTGSLMFGVGVNSDSGLTGSIVLNERNFDILRPPTSFDDFINGTAFRGAGQEMRIEAVPGTQLQRYVATFREPFLLDSPYSLTVSGYYFERQYNEYNEDRVGGRVTLGRKVSDYWSVLGTVRVENINVNNVSIFAPQDYTSVVGDNFLAGFRAGVNRDTRDSLLRPTEGSLLDISFEECIGSHVFPLASIDYTQFWTVMQRADGSGRQVLSFHSNVSWAGANTPVYERYFAGGFRSIRGFQFRGVGPSVDGFMVGGDFMVLNSLEYQVPVRASDSIFLVGFVDSGAVTARADHIDDYRVSVGFGIRFVVPMLGPVPIALDFGFPIVKAPTDQQQIFNFFMGFSR
jgi:outer membrane protein assembly complex protein YaeT